MPKLVQESLNIYKQMIVVKSIPIVQEVYTSVLVDTEISFATVLKYSNAPNMLMMCEEDVIQQQLVQQRGVGIKMLESFKNAETSLLFNLCVLNELGFASKTNLISVRIDLKYPPRRMAFLLCLFFV